MRFSTLVFRRGAGASFDGPGPNFAVLDYVMPQRYGVIHSSMVPDLSYEDNTLENWAAPWRFRMDEEGRSMYDRIMEECEVIHVLVRVDWNG